ncbi:MAG TPA: hypothetical protein VFW09_04220 [Solirubrobacteraceae bacterium]|nr:hypothetical protein [Solirubrobacteraceae bacterium]
MQPGEHPTWPQARARLAAEGIEPDPGTEAVLRDGYPGLRGLIDAVHAVGDAAELDGLLILDAGDASASGGAATPPAS